MIPDDGFIVGLTYTHVVDQKRQFYLVCTAIVFGTVFSQGIRYMAWTDLVLDSVEHGR